ncbi:tyrosine-type recombinase/integrase [Microbacterium sp. NPDC057650]|uniref:tyrosine-type recombinase/integrase n=1 Tax=unclassified Microbacterium TaxID=2609290 RepID=UPI00366C6549
MDRTRWDGLVQEFLHHRAFARGTREAYDLALRNYLDWCQAGSVDPESATKLEFLYFRRHLIDRRLADHTVRSRFKAVRRFYDFLVQSEVVGTNSALNVDLGQYPMAFRNVLTFDELCRMWDVTSGRERVIVGLLGICAMRRDEIRVATIEDLRERSEMTFIEIPRRQHSFDLGYVVIPELLTRELRTELGDRRSGLLIPGRDGKQQVAASYVNQVVRRAGTRAGVPFAVTTLTLTYALRRLAVENRFSYVSVVRSAADGDPRRLNEFLRNVDLPFREHSSVRLGNMVEARLSADSQLLLQSENLLLDRYQQPATAVMMAGATLERVLREVSMSHGLVITKKDPTISTYATLLRSEELISIGQLRTVERILSFRNDAAHGWFESIARSDADWVLQEVRKLIPALRSTQRIPVG